MALGRPSFLGIHTILALWETHAVCDEIGLVGLLIKLNIYLDAQLYSRADDFFFFIFLCC